MRIEVNVEDEIVVGNGILWWNDLGLSRNE
jgi:hypothetical protein